ncbi:MAG: T9SS type A sorting domain-containing protein [Flavobacteriales bacterium]|nr:T9SS type A sorting domain-containing protein [Flavobacteriales bacterium]
MKNTLILLSALLFYCTASVGQSLNDSLIAHFPLDGSPNDVIGLLTPTVTHGTPGSCTDRFGDPNGAACFDGASFWSYGDVLDMDTSRYTIALWCRIDSITPNATHHDYPLAKGTTVSGTPPLSGYSFGFRDDLPDTISAAAMFGNNTQALLIMDHPVSFGAWYHYTISRCAEDELSFFVNGVLVAADQLAPNKNLSTNIHFSIGAADRAPADPPAGFFRGVVDDVRIYKGRCLSQAEVDTLALDLLSVGSTPIKKDQLGLELSPNPATQTLRIDLTGSEKFTGPVLVLNALGQAVPITNGSLGQTGTGVRSLTVDVSGLPNGAYFVVVATEKGRVHGRFVKE